jgi:hypothetical protein
MSGITGSRGASGTGSRERGTAMEMTGVKAIKTFFEQDGRPVSYDELKSLSREDREELAPLAAKELGVEVTKAS